MDGSGKLSAGVKGSFCECVREEMVAAICND